MGGDHVLSGVACSGYARFWVASTRAIAQELRVRHDASPVMTAALGRLATVTVVLGTMQKSDDHQVTVQVRGDGPGGKLFAVATGRGEVRAYADHAEVDLPPKPSGKLDVGAAVGQEGALVVIKDLGLREPYRGSVPLVSGEIGEDFTYYFAVSEQTPTSVAVGVLVDRDHSVKAAGGLIVQLLPEAPDAVIGQVERAMSGLAPVTTLLASGSTPQDIVSTTLPDVRILSTRPVRFACTCSKERLGRILVSLGAVELEDMIATGGAELVCHWCESRYAFDRGELQQLYEAARKKGSV